MTNTRLLLLTLAALALYWLPALVFPDAVKASVNALLFIASGAVVWMLLPDMYDLWRWRGDGMSWQAVVVKLGLFLMTASFCAARVWSFASVVSDFPGWMLASPISSFFVYLMGIGLGCIFLGLNSAGEEAFPPLTRSALVQGALILIFGILIGVAVSRVPVWSPT